MTRNDVASQDTFRKDCIEFVHRVVMESDCPQKLKDGIKSITDIWAQSTYGTKKYKEHSSEFKMKVHEYQDWLNVQKQQRNEEKAKQLTLKDLEKAYCLNPTAENAAAYAKMAAAESDLPVEKCLPPGWFCTRDGSVAKSASSTF